MARVGIVVEVNGDSAQVSTTRRGPCGSCSEHHSCAMPVGPTENSPEIVTADNRAGAKAGDTVEIELPGHTELKLSLLVWTVPTAGLIAGAILGVRLHAPLGVGEDPAAMVGALVGFLASYILLKVVDRKVAGDPRLVPRVVRVLRNAGCQTLAASTPESAGPVNG